jgi:hypothetical protein
MATVFSLQSELIELVTNCQCSLVLDKLMISLKLSKHSTFHANCYFMKQNPSQSLENYLVQHFKHNFEKVYREQCTNY